MISYHDNDDGITNHWRDGMMINDERMWILGLGMMMEWDGERMWILESGMILGYDNDDGIANHWRDRRVMTYNRREILELDITSSLFNDEIITEG